MTMRIANTLAAVTILIGGLNGVSAADWPMYRGDAARSGYTAEAFPNQVRLHWVHRVKHAPRPAWPMSERMRFDQAFQPIVVGTTVVFGSSADDRVIALDAATGRERWTFFTDGPVRFAPAAWRDRLFVAGDGGCLYALSVADGRLLWKHHGGPDDRKVIGNERVISHWPARGGPVVWENRVYYAAGIWPSDGVYLHALDAETGRVVWTNDKTGPLDMAQPHGGAQSKSGVSAQGYLLASAERVFVPTGRAVPAAFLRADGRLDYYHLQRNQHRGGSAALLADAYLVNAGCLFDRRTGTLASRTGYGSMVAMPSGIVRSEGRSLAVYRWKNATRRDRRGKSIKYRALEKVRLVPCENDVTTFIVTGSDAVCGETGRVCAIDYSRQRNTWWSHDVEGAVRGIAYANGRLIVSTDRGMIYCFDGEPQQDRRDSVGSATAGEGTGETADPAVDTVDYAAAAQEIINKSGLTAGLCVDLGCGDGRLLVELARRTTLRIYAVDADVKRVAAARRRLHQAGLYGVRVTVHQGNPATTGLPQYVANLVVSSRSLTEDLSQKVVREMNRIQRPYGGVVCIGRRGAMKATRRGPLIGAGRWTHQNADPANTICSMDRLVKGPLEMFWFRDVAYRLPNRHGQGPAPLYVRGIMVVGGVDGLCALDAYNGRTLWTFQLKGNLKDYNGIHHDVGVGETGSNFCLGGGSVFVRNGTRCLRIDLATGKKLAEFHTPASTDDGNRAWGYLSYNDGVLYGSVAYEQQTVSPRYRLSKLYTESVRLFALDARTGRLKWSYRPRYSIRNNTIAIGGGSLFLIDRPLVAADRITRPRRDGRPRLRLKPGELPDAVLIALNAITGRVRWKQTDDVFGTQLAVSEKHGVVLMNFQAVRHNFFKLPSEIGGRIAGIDASTGRRLWNQQADYKVRPFIIDTVVYVQDGAWNLKTGRPVAFKLNRSYGCGQISAGANLLLFRSGTLGYLDLSRDAGTENYGGIRPSCWINAIPAGGLVLVPDGSTKCQCSYQMKAWFALQPRR